MTDTDKQDLFYHFILIRDKSPYLRDMCRGKKRKQYVKSTTRYIREISDRASGIPLSELPLYINNPKLPTMLRDMIFWRLKHNL